eukprot:1158244-Pelagomonas_calceolata.AAC.13
MTDLGQEGELRACNLRPFHPAKRDDHFAFPADLELISGTFTLHGDLSTNTGPHCATFKPIKSVKAQALALGLLSQQRLPHESLPTWRKATHRVPPAAHAC